MEEKVKEIRPYIQNDGIEAILIDEVPGVSKAVITTN